MGALAIEIWTTNPGIKMDNFAVAYDEKAMKDFYKARRSRMFAYLRISLFTAIRFRSSQV